MEEMQALERELRGLALALDFPPAAELAAGVRSDIEAGRVPKRRLLEGWSPELGRRLALAGATAVLLAVAILSFSPAAREAVADLLGLRGVGIRVTESPPPSAPAPTGPLSGFMDVGERVSLAQAQEAVDYEIRLPTDRVAPPDEIYLSDDPEGGRVTSFFRAGPGLPRIYETGTGAMLTQFIGELDRNTIGKLVAEDTTIERVEVNGNRGLWVKGDHLFFLYRAGGTVIEETIRMSDSALLWQEGDVTLRLESGLSLEAAIRLAESAY
jgi:hypothetical protein